MTNKQIKLNETENKVRAATRSLADKRQQVARAQSATSELEQIKQKIENARKALTLVPSQDWSGRGALSSEIRGEAVAPTAFRQVQVGNIQFGSGEDIPLPERGSEGSLARLRRIRAWEERIGRVLEDKLFALEGESADKAVKYRRLVSLCTKVPVDKVDGVSGWHQVGKDWRLMIVA
jgi:regulatory protein SWI6